jgi:hypothetical protein
VRLTRRERLAEFLDSGSIYARIDAERLFTFFTPPDQAQSRTLGACVRNRGHAGV